jgi:aminopeptidase N
VIDAPFSYALETQTLSIFSRSIAVTTTRSERIQVHELAHQWFGDSLTLTRWQDIWLNEGFASYTESLWLERTQPGFDIDGEMSTYAAARYGPIGAPALANLFAAPVYLRGALVLHALRRTLGDTTFFAILSDYAMTHRNGNVDTTAFVAVVNKHAGRSMNDFVDQWINAPQAPALPK